MHAEFASHETSVDLTGMAPADAIRALALSTWDYFLPNTSGQAVLAQISYQAGFNW